MNPGHLSWHDYLAMIGGAALAISLFLPWYHAENKRVNIAGGTGPGDFTGWEVHDLQRYILLVAAVAPFILVYIVMRGHKLSWARGELTAVIAITAFGLVAYSGLIGKPGEPRGLISLEWGWFVALAGVIATMVGSALRASESERPRKPPGVM